MGTPLYPKDLGTEWMKLKQDVKAAVTATGRKTPFEKIGAGILKVFETLEIQAGGLIKFIWGSGVTGMIMGRHLMGADPAEGIYITRPDGSTAFWIVTRLSDGFGYTALMDQNGNIILGDDGVTEQGLARPWLSIPMAPTGELTNPPVGRQTGGTTDVAVYSTVAPMQHSWMKYWGYIYTSVAGATAEVKFKNLTTGVTMDAKTGPSGFIDSNFAIGDYTFGEEHQIDVTIRRASGTGNVGLTLLSVEGTQTP